MNSAEGVIRVCWWAPWFRSLARNYIEISQIESIDWSLLTSDSHLDSNLPSVDWEVCIRSSKNWKSKPRHFVQTLQALLRIRPHLIIADEPRAAYQALILAITSLLRPMAVVLHDAQPHDAAHELGRVTTHFRNRLFSRAKLFIAMSRHTESLLQAAGLSPTAVLPLLPEAPNYRTMQPAANRQHFAMVGRWSTYKGFDIGIQAYEAFTKRYGFNNELHLWLSGAPDMQALPEGVICKSTSAFSWESLLKELPNYHAVLLPYRNGSQSGVQILAWSCGVPAIVSDIQGLIQLQPKCLPAISITHIDGWVDAMRLVVQDEELGAISGKGRHDIMSKLAPEVVSAALKSCIASSLEISL